MIRVISSAAGSVPTPSLCVSTDVPILVSHDRDDETGESRSSLSCVPSVIDGPVVLIPVAYPKTQLSHDARDNPE